MAKRFITSDRPALRTSLGGSPEQRNMRKGPMGRGSKTIIRLTAPVPEHLQKIDQRKANAAKKRVWRKRLADSLRTSLVSFRD